MSLTGVVTIQQAASAIPAAGTSTIFHVTASDGAKSKSGVVTLKVQSSSGVCGCPIFTVLTGPLPSATVNQPYAVTLAVVGPPSDQIRRPTYRWKVRNGSNIPPGLVLDKARGVLRGTPSASASGHVYNFYVDVTETHTLQKAQSTSFYTLQVN